MSRARSEFVYEGSGGARRLRQIRIRYRTWPGHVRLLEIEREVSGPLERYRAVIEVPTGRRLAESLFEHRDPGSVNAVGEHLSRILLGEQRFVGSGSAAACVRWCLRGLEQPVDDPQVETRRETLIDLGNTVAAHSARTVPWVWAHSGLTLDHIHLDGARVQFTGRASSVNWMLADLSILAEAPLRAFVRSSPGSKHARPTGGGEGADFDHARVFRRALTAPLVGWESDAWRMDLLRLFLGAEALRFVASFEVDTSRLFDVDRTRMLPVVDDLMRLPDLRG